MNAAPSRTPLPVLTAAVGWALAWVLVGLAQLMLGSLTVKPYDEGLTLFGASAVAHGRAPYVDFWTLYGPGSFYALAGINRLFGESVLVGRAFDACARAAIVLMVFALTRRRAGSAVASLAALLAFAVLAGVREYLFPALPATALALLSIACAEFVLTRGTTGDGHWPARPRAWLWALPGFVVGLTTLFRHDFGLFAALALALPLVHDRAPGRAARGVAFVSGVLIAVGPAAAALLLRVPAADVYDNLVRIPLEVYVAYRSLAFPSVVQAVGAALDMRSLAPLGVLLAFVPLGVAAVGVPLALRARSRQRGDLAGAALSQRRVSESLLLLTVLLCVKGTIRFQLVHMLPALIVSIVVLGRAWRPSMPRAVARFGAAAVLFGLAGSAVVFAGRSGPRPDGGEQQPPALALADWAKCRHGTTPRLGCFEIGPDRAAVLAWLRDHARPGDRLYVGAGRHDKLLINNVELYFLSGLAPVTKWHDLHPGVQTSRLRQAAMIAEMTAHPPAFVVLNSQWDASSEPNRSSVSSGVVLLDEYLARRFVEVFRSGTFSVLVPRASPPLEPVSR
jgi:hypothetical protein